MFGVIEAILNKMSNFSSVTLLTRSPKQKHAAKQALIALWLAIYWLLLNIYIKGKIGLLHLLCSVHVLNSVGAKASE